MSATIGAAGLSVQSGPTFRQRKTGRHSSLATSNQSLSALTKKPASSRTPLSTCRSSLPTSRPVSAISRSEAPRYAQGNTDGAFPQELATLEQLVSQLSKSGNSEEDADVAELKRAFGALAEDLKRQISSVKLSAPGTSPGTPGTRKNSRISGAASSQKVPGRRRLTPATDSESFKASAGLSDLEGLFPRSQAQRSAENAEGGKAAEPMVPRSEVVSIRSRLNKKLSESNTYNRFLMREIQYREEAVKDTKAVLAALVSELRQVSAVVTELATVESFLPTSQISHQCRPSLVAVKVQGLLDDLEKQLQGVDAMKLREVPLVWYGMAEDVKVMGSFDGWTYGEQMSPETTGSMTRFTTTLKVRPGKYEIKFMVDGEWRVAPEWPTSGYGMTENNILVVD